LDNNKPIHDLLQMLSDLVDADEPSRVDLLTPIEQNPQTFSQKHNMGITDHFHDALRDIFTLYASKKDGSMSLMDFRRYVLSVGAGQHSASADRVSNVFSQFEPDFHEARRLRFDGFCSFYKEACVDRLNYVWSDLFTQQFLPNLRRNGAERGSVRDLIAKHPEYESILRRVLSMRQKQRPTFFSFLVKLPVPDRLRWRLYRMEEPLSVIFKVDASSCRRMMAIVVMILHELSRDQEWRRRFVAENGGLDYLWRLIVFLSRTADIVDAIKTNHVQSFHLGQVHISGLLFNVCSESRDWIHGKWTPQLRRRWCIKSVVMKLKQSAKTTTALHLLENELFADSEPIKHRRHELLHAICRNAHRDEKDRIPFLDDLPRDLVVATQSLPLIAGFARNEFQLSSLHFCEIPDDIRKVIACFF